MLVLDKNNFNETLNNNKKVLVDLWAPWCGPCRMLGPVLEEASQIHTDIVFGKVNVDENPEIAQAFRCMSIPMVLLFEEGKLVNQFVGYRSLEQVNEFLK